MKPLKIGITGVRGIVGETFTPEVAVGFAQAFATYLNGARVLICRDPDGRPMVRPAVVAGLLVRGSNTEPIIRVIAEAEHQAEAQAIIDRVYSQVQECFGQR
jgi:phosphomannomutase